MSMCVCVMCSVFVCVCVCTSHQRRRYLKPETDESQDDWIEGQRDEPDSGLESTFSETETQNSGLDETTKNQMCKGS